MPVTLKTCPECGERGPRERMYCDKHEAVRLRKARERVELDRHRAAQKRAMKHSTGQPCVQCERPNAWLWNDGFCCGTCRELWHAEKLKRDAAVAQLVVATTS